MAQNDMPPHNPQTGFADITALPDFSYWSLSPLLLALVGLLVACALAFFLYKRLRRQKPLIAIDPVTEATEKINGLRTLLVGDIPQTQLRLIASELAETIRIFLTKKINFQAVGLTSKEIAFALDLNFKPLFPNPTHSLDTLISSIKTLFAKTEIIAFAKDINIAKTDLSAVIDIASDIVGTVDKETKPVQPPLIGKTTV